MKKLPLALVVGLILEATFGVARLAHYGLMDGFNEASYVRWGIFESCFDFTNAVLISVGLFQVATGLRGNQALGARIAGWAMALEVVVGVAWGVIGSFSYSRGSWVETYVSVLNWFHPIAYLGVAIGIVVATKKLGRGIAAVVIVVALMPIPPLRDAMHDIGFGKTLSFILTFSPYILVSLAWLAMFVTTEVELPPASVSADAAYNSAARSIWIRVIAACSLAGITLLVALSGEQGMMSLFRGVSILSPIVDALALGLLARAALQLARVKIAPGITMASATFALLATGAVLAHVPTLYRVLFGDHGYGMNEDATQSAVLVYAIALALFSITALTLIAVSVANLARERNAEDVRENVSIRIGVFVVLSLGSLFVSTYGASHLPNSRGVVLFVLLALVFAAFYSLVLIAKICATGAELVARDPVGLPTAKMVQRQ